MDDIAMTPPRAGRRARTASRCGGRSPTACSATSAPASIRRAAACRPRPSCRQQFRRQPPHGAPRAGGAVARRPGAGGAGPRLIRRRGRAGIRGRSRAPGSPNGSAGTTWSRPAALLQLKETAADAHVAAGLGIRAGSRVVLLERLGFADDRPVSLAQHYFPAARLRGMLDALRHSPTITEALKAVGVTDYLRQVDARHGAAAERGARRNCCACRATGRCWSPRTSTSTAPARWWSSASRAIRRRACRSSSNPERQAHGTTADHRRTGAAALGRRADGGCAAGRWPHRRHRRAARRGSELDARGLLVLPGIVDIHGDAFERQLQPRPGVGFRRRHRVARYRGAAAGERHHHGVPRRDAVMGAGAAQPRRPGRRCSMRWRRGAGPATCACICAGRRSTSRRWTPRCADIAAGRVHLLAFNDHTPAILKKINDPVVGAKYSDRAGMKLDEFRDAGRADRRARAGRAGRAGPHRRRGAGGRPADGEPRRRQHRHARRVPRPRRADLRVPHGRGGRQAGARRRRLGGHGLPQRGARRLASRLGLGGAHGRGRDLQRAVVATISIRRCCAPRSILAGARRARPAARLGADLGQSRAPRPGSTDRGAIARGLRADLVLVDPAVPRVVATIAGGRIAISPPRARPACMHVRAAPRRG